MKTNKPKNLYASALKYEAQNYRGIVAICNILSPDGQISTGTAWRWIRKHESNPAACKKMLKKIIVI